MRRRSKDFKYRDQIKDSSSSAPSNIAEGFGRFRPGEFARFLEFARASLIETRNHLIDGRDRGYLANPLYSRLQNLARAALRSTTNLMLAKKRDAERSNVLAAGQATPTPFDPFHRTLASSPSTLETVTAKHLEDRDHQALW